MKIVIVEDHQMFRDALRNVCEKELRHEVVAEAADGAQAVTLVTQHQPDLVLLDLNLPALDGFGVLAEVRTAAPRARVLILSSHCDEYTVYRAEQLAVEGFLDKNSNSVATLKRAITALASGQTWFSEAFLREKNARRTNPLAVDKLLTKRERSILGLIGQPMTDAEISEQLGIAVETVEKHRFNLLRKLALKSTSELARYAREHGFTLGGGRAGPGALLP